MDSSINMDDEVEIILQQDHVEVTEPLVADYILPTASASTLGGVKIGSNVSVDAGGTISIPTASADTKGVIRIGSGLTVDSDGIVSASGSSYVLPQATKNTLGGVYVDDELSNNSQNPVQNAVVSLAIGQTNGNVSSLSSTVGGLSTTVGNLSTTVGNLSTTVGNLSTTVGNLSNQVGTNTSNISSLSSRVGDVEGDVTTLDDNVTTLLTETYESYLYSDIDSNVWTAGLIALVSVGMMGYINIELDGSLTISAGASETIYTLTNLLPAYDVCGVLVTDAGVIKVKVTTGGVITFTNLSASSITITEVAGSLPIEVASDGV